MARILLLILLVLNFSIVNGYCVNYVEDANCEAAWLFNVDQEAGDILDQTTNSNDLSVLGDGEPDYTASGKFDGAYVWDGSNDYAYTGTFTPPAGAYTQVVWVKADDTSSRCGMNFAATAGSGTQDRRIDFDSDSYPQFYVYNDAQYLTTNTTSIDTDWHHLAGTIDTTDGNSIWVDGVEKGTNAGGTDGYNGYAGTAEFYIGNTAGQAFYYDGTMDEIAIFSRTLNSTEINDIMDNGLVGAVAAAVMQPIINIF